MTPKRRASARGMREGSMGNGVYRHSDYSLVTEKSYRETSQGRKWKGPGPNDRERSQGRVLDKNYREDSNGRWSRGASRGTREGSHGRGAEAVYRNPLRRGTERSDRSVDQERSFRHGREEHDRLYREGSRGRGYEWFPDCTEEFGFGGLNLAGSKKEQVASLLSELTMALTEDGEIGEFGDMLL